jgi:hypothetical protein
VDQSFAKKSLVLAVLMLGLSSVFPAFAADPDKLEKAEPTVPTYAWFWQDQQQHKVTNPVDGSDAATFELKNPYCPDTSPVGSPPEQICKPGRLPVEVRNDYEKPAKLSAINFDLSMVLPGSDVKEFTVRLWEAQDGFSRNTQYNLDGKKIQACVIEKVFGEGEARLYSEMPTFKCSKRDAIATRKSTTIKGEAADTEAFYWDLDLTDQAKEWVKEGVFFTSVMLHPVEPKEITPQDGAWQVVFAGPLETKYGIDSKIVFDPAEMPIPKVPEVPEDPISENDPLTPETETSTDSSTGYSSSPSTTTDVGSSAPTSPTTGDTPTDTPTGEEPTTEGPAPATGTELASATETAPSGMPLYMWLAILAGIAGFSMVRSVVLEKNSGVRPDGVLAQIQKLNAQRRGTTATAATGGASPFAGLMAGLGAIGGRVTAGAGKLAQLVSRKKG